MLSKEVRNRKLTFKPEHLCQRFKERKHLFPFDSSSKEMFSEVIEAIKNPNKGVIVEDSRNEASSHICIFLGDSGKLIAVPLAVKKDNIHIFTIKDVRAEESNPNWFIRQYNMVAEKRGLEKINLIFKETT